MSQLPIAVHVGSEPPSTWEDIEARQRAAGDDAGAWLREKRRPTIARSDLDWASTRIEPRWVGFDTADCVAALQPSIYHNQGADEFDRFREGAASRGELAIVISPIGSAEGTEYARSLFSSHDDSLSLGRVESNISSRPLGIGAKVRAAAGLDDIGHLLALRMLSLKPAPKWRALELEEQTWERHDGRVSFPPQGELEPIVETELGEPVVAVWISPDGVERRYIVPVETPWAPLLSWLVEQALPELVPGAMLRSRRNLGADPAWMTNREQQARAALAQLDAEYRASKARLVEELETVEAAASSVRDGLLYGSGQRLADTARIVLKAADITVLDIDELLGDTKNADLLCSFQGCARLVEVKSSAGSAPERAYEDLMRHLREWPHLQGSTRVDGGALIINHQHRLIPQERHARPYTRPEFVAAQSEPVITALELFNAWRAEDWPAVRRLVFGEAHSARAFEADAANVRNATPEAPGQKRRWYQRR